MEEEVSEKSGRHCSAIHAQNRMLFKIAEEYWIEEKFDQQFLEVSLDQ